MSLEKRLDQIGETDIQALKTNQIPEGKTLDYKRDPVGNADEDKKEFRADVTSFANSSGGNLIFGVEEADGVPISIPGLNITDPDAEILRIESMIRDSVQPRIPNVTCKAISLSNGKPCIVVRIPQSWAMPHAVIHKKYMQFFARTSNGKYSLDVPELKAAFLLSASVAERIRAFRAERLSMIVSGETPVPLPEGPKVVYHFIPASAFTSPTRYDFAPLTRGSQRVEGIYKFGTSSRYNMDGMVFHSLGEYIRPGEEAWQYAQVFRTGIIEAVDAFGLSGPIKKISGYDYDSRIVDHTKGFVANCKQLGIEPPLFLMISMIGVRGFTISIDARGGTSIADFRPIDRDGLFLPDTQIDDYDMPMEEILKPMLDSLWNAAGWAHSHSYNADGAWQGKP